jgi:hypothetical protein
MKLVDKIEKIQVCMHRKNRINVLNISQLREINMLIDNDKNTLSNATCSPRLKKELIFHLCLLQYTPCNLEPKIQKECKKREYSVIARILA